MSKSNLRIEQSSDISLLSRMYLEMAVDERSDTAYTDASARQNLSVFFRKGEKAYVFTRNGETVGYALVNPNRSPVYLHHFYICRSARRQGSGTAAFHLLMRTLCVDEIDLDVFVWNERGSAFWQSLGFRPRATMMRYSADQP